MASTETVSRLNIQLVEREREKDNEWMNGWIDGCVKRQIK